MDIEEVREQFRLEGESVSCIPLYFDDAMKWLISEHDRLTAANAKLRQALERIAHEYDPKVSREIAIEAIGKALVDEAICIAAREALKEGE